jgi:hypothetical protein
VKMIVAVTVIVTMTVTMVVTFGLNLYFKGVERGKEMGLYPPFNWCQRTKGFGASFKLETEN